MLAADHLHLALFFHVHKELIGDYKIYLRKSKKLIQTVGFSALKQFPFSSVG